MNTAIINISLPIKMYNDAKNFLANNGYASISEFVRDELRETLYPKLTKNGFTPEFEERILKAAAEPVKNDIVWDGKTPFTEFVLKQGKKRYGKR